MLRFRPEPGTKQARHGPPLLHLLGPGVCVCVRGWGLHRPLHGRLQGRLGLTAPDNRNQQRGEPKLLQEGTLCCSASFSGTPTLRLPQRAGPPSRIVAAPPGPLSIYLSVFIMNFEPASPSSPLPPVNALREAGRRPQPGERLT